MNFPSYTSFKIENYMTSDDFQENMDFFTRKVVDANKNKVLGFDEIVRILNYFFWSKEIKNQMIQRIYDLSKAQNSSNL
jgi:hypothetical protein